MITPFLTPPPTAKEAGPETGFLPKILGIDYPFCKETRFLNPQPRTRNQVSATIVVSSPKFTKETRFLNPQPRTRNRVSATIVVSSPKFTKETRFLNPQPRTRNRVSATIVVSSPKFMKETRFLKYKGQVKIWYDQDADFLEVIFSEKPGFMRETDDDSM